MTKISSSNNSISVDRVEAIAANAGAIRNMTLPEQAVCICAEINARHCPVHSANVTAQPLKDNIAKEDVMAAGFDHPCKKTCSGWQQGFDRGQFELRQRLVEVEAELDRRDSAYEKASHQALANGGLVLDQRAELERLEKIIAKELSENDELGCEFTYVNILKQELAEAKAEHQHWFDTDYTQCLKRRNELKAALERIAYETLREFAWVKIAKEALEGEK